MCVNETQIKVLWNTHAALSSQTVTHFQHPFRHRTHSCVQQDIVSPASQIQNVRHNPLPLVYILYSVFQMLAFLPPSSYGMTLYGKIYSKNAHGSVSLIPKMEGIWNIFLIFNKRVSIMAIISKRGMAQFSEVCVNLIYIR